MDEPRAMREIHEIRERIYERTKDMTPEERNALVHKQAQELLDRYGIKVKTVSVPERQQMRRSA
ncbi:MAG: hypothetical protein FWC27_02395 [Firmicutes bacterium]|nr:hypothetical protein [Bacillota bacterium]